MAEHSTAYTVPYHGATVPIRNLPPEILARIFQISRCYNSLDYRRTSAAENTVHPATLSSVCTTWRRVALNLPWLWSHIEFATQWVAVTEGQSNHLRLMTERSLGELIELSICVQHTPMVRYEDSNLVAEHITDDVLAQLCDLLAPLAPRIHVLDVYSDVYAGSELQAILACATQLCASGALHMLVIHAKDNPDTSTQMLPWDPLHIINSPGDDQLNRFAEPVEVLHLVNVSIDWSNNLYRGLTELSITFTDLVDHLSCSQMVQILTGCPELHRLSLNNLYAVGWDGPDAELRTVNLCRLDYLKLVCSDPKLLAPLLQILRRPTGQWLHVRIGVDDEPEFVEQLQAFFRESRNVSILDVTSGNGTGWFTPICNGLDDSLARLILRGCDFADPDFVHFISTSKNRHRNLWSWLRMIELDYCTVDTASLEWLTCRGFVQVVKLTDCYVRDPGSGVCTLASLSMFTSKLPRHVSVTIENQEGA